MVFLGIQTIWIPKNSLGSHHLVLKVSSIVYIYLFVLALYSGMDITITCMCMILHRTQGSLVCVFEYIRLHPIGL